MKIVTGIEGILKFCLSSLKGCNIGVIGGSDLRSAPLKWAQVGIIYEASPMTSFLLQTKPAGINNLHFSRGFCPYKLPTLFPKSRCFFQGRVLNWIHPITLEETELKELKYKKC